MANTRLNGWTKPLLAMLVPLLAAAVAFGVTQANVDRNHEDITRVEVQADAARAALEERLTRQLDRMEDKLDRLLEQP